MTVASAESGCIIRQAVDLLVGLLLATSSAYRRRRSSPGTPRSPLPLVHLAQLLLDGAQLLAQEVFALGLAHLFLCLGLYPGLDLGELHFLQELVDMPETLNGVDDLQHMLGFLHLEP